MVVNLADEAKRLDRQEEERQAADKAARLGMPYLNLSKKHLDPEVLAIIPKTAVESLQCLALVIEGTALTVGVVGPDNPAVMDGLQELGSAINYQLKLNVISLSSFNYGKKTYDLFVRQSDQAETIDISDKDKRELDNFAKELELDPRQASVNVSNLLLLILSRAVEQEASDIHFEPAGRDLIIRFRLDGVLHERFKLSNEIWRGLSSRLKYLSRMSMTTTTHPQDGRLTITVDKVPLDLRLADLPIVGGDMITVRILRQDLVNRHISDLGLRPDLEEAIRRAIHRPHGVTLVTGPTGSGKTTTMYAMLQELNTEENKIITIEDPVEYQITGLEQSQVDPEHGYDFAQALRGALRQDPDIVMIGEIRDQETAEIGIRAALTGHEVLATLHANAAPAALNRLMEIGVEPFLFLGSINIIIAQRLVRLLCQQCRKPRPLNEREILLFKEKLGRVPALTYDPVGCQVCHQTGYKGRTGIFEALIPGHSIEEMVLRRSSLPALEAQAIQDGYLPMLIDGLIKIEQGVTTTSEVLRVTED